MKEGTESLGIGYLQSLAFVSFPLKKGVPNGT